MPQYGLSQLGQTGLASSAETGGTSPLAKPTIPKWVIYGVISLVALVAVYFLFIKKGKVRRRAIRRRR